MDDLAQVSEELCVFLNFHIDSIQEAQAPDDIAIAADSACTYFQGVAICELLLDAEVDAFFHLMIRSGRTRRWLLSRAQGHEGYPAKIMKPSNTRGLFASIVAKDWTLAREIAALSPRDWDAKVEYEDDFHYARVLHGLVAGEPPETQQVLLDDYARALDGDEPARFRLCRGLIATDAEDARSAFRDLIGERRRELEELATTLLATDELFVPLSAVYVEGLAWLRLLNRVNLPTDREYPFCPSLARIDDFTPYRPDGFPD
jgi:hypothetical protein